MQRRSPATPTRNDRYCYFIARKSSSRGLRVLTIEGYERLLLTDVSTGPLSLLFLFFFFLLETKRASSFSSSSSSSSS